MQIIIATIEEAASLEEKLPSVLVTISKSYSEKRQQSFLAGRKLLLKALREFYQLNCLAKIENNEHGKPYFQDKAYPFFNISHSAGYLCLALGDCEKGIDVEYVKKRNLFKALKEKVLSKTELLEFEELNDAQQNSLFTLLWTIRESLMKVTGRGLVDLGEIKLNLQQNEIEYKRAQGLLVETMAFDELINTNSSYLSFSRGEKEIPYFYRLEANQFVELNRPQSLRLMKVI